MKFVHAADLHLDSPLVGLGRYPGAPVDEVRGATRAAMKNLVSLCIEERVDLLLLAGDIFDGDWKDYSTGLFYCSELLRLRECGTTVVAVRGNHDAQSSIAPNLRLPAHVVELSAAAPETRILDDLGVAVHGQSFPRRDVTDDLARRYPAPVPGLLNIGLLHTAMSGSEWHEPYAPCTRLTLEGKGYAYWALGHVHRHEIVSSAPWIVYPGNLQGRHARETGPKGAVLVETEGTQIVRVEARALDVLRWCSCEVDVTDIGSRDELLDRVGLSLRAALHDADGRFVAARVVVSGATSLYQRILAAQEQWDAEVRAIALDVGEGRLWIERVLWLTRAERAEELGQGGAVGQILRSFAELESDVERRAVLLESLREVEDTLPPELRHGPDALRLTDPASLDALLGDVRGVVLGALFDVVPAGSGAGGDPGGDE